MYYTTKGLILRQTAYQESDLIMDVLTGDLGKLTVKARGVRRKNSTLRSGCQLLSYSEMTLYERNGYYTVREAEPIELFSGLREDIELLSLGSYFAQVLGTVAAEDQVSPGLLSLGLNSLFALSALKKDQKLVKSVFELRLMGISGFAPELEGCALCGDPLAVRFYFREGVLLCERCRGIEKMGQSRRLSEGVLAAMRHILQCPEKRLFSFSLPERAMGELAEVTEQFLLSQLEQNFYTLDFYKRLFITT